MEYTNTIAVLNEFADYFINEYKSKLASQGWQSGKLYNSIKKVSVKSVSNNFELVLHLQDYWKYIEYGRKAGKQPNRMKMPPIKEISKWIKKKNIIPQPIKLKSGKTVVPKQTQLAFLISRSILKNGFKNPIQPKPFLKESLQKSKDDFMDRIKEALTQDLIEEGFNISK